MSGGPSRNRTGVRGFAVLYVTTPPSGLDIDFMQYCALSVVLLRAINGSVADMQCRDALRGCEIGVSSESLLAFVVTVIRSNV